MGSISSLFLSFSLIFMLLHVFIDLKMHSNGVNFLSISFSLIFMLLHVFIAFSQSIDPHFYLFPHVNLFFSPTLYILLLPFVGRERAHQGSLWPFLHVFWGTPERRKGRKTGEQVYHSPAQTLFLWKGNNGYLSFIFFSLFHYHQFYSHHIWSLKLYVHKISFSHTQIHTSIIYIYMHTPAEIFLFQTGSQNRRSKTGKKSEAKRQKPQGQGNNGAHEVAWIFSSFSKRRKKRVNEEYKQLSFLKIGQC